MLYFVLFYQMLSEFIVRVTKATFGDKAQRQGLIAAALQGRGDDSVIKETKLIKRM